MGVAVVLEFLTDSGWREIGGGSTDSDGRCPNLLPEDHNLEPGIYRLYFDTQEYFESQKLKCFYPNVPVTFEIEDVSQHYHVPLLLSPFGYSTYRGS